MPKKNSPNGPAVIRRDPKKDDQSAKQIAWKAALYLTPFAFALIVLRWGNSFPPSLIIVFAVFAVGLFVVSGWLHLKEVGFKKDFHDHPVLYVLGIVLCCSLSIGTAVYLEMRPTMQNQVTNPNAATQPAKIGVAEESTAPAAASSSPIPQQPSPPPADGLSAQAQFEAMRKKEDRRFKVEAIRWAKKINAEYPDKTAEEKQGIIWAQLKKEGFNPTTASRTEPGAVTLPIKKSCSEMSGFRMNGITAIGASVAGIRVDNPSPCSSLTNVHTEGGMYGVLIVNSPPTQAQRAQAQAPPE